MDQQPRTHSNDGRLPSRSEAGTAEVSAPHGLTGERRTAWFLLLSMTGLAGLFTVTALATALHLVAFRLGFHGYSPWRYVLVGCLLTIACGLLARCYRMGDQRGVRLILAIIAMVLTAGMSPESFATGIPQTVWIAPIGAFALTSLRWGLFVTMLSLGCAALLPGVHWPEGPEVSRYFAAVAIGGMLAAGRVRYQQMLAAEQRRTEAALQAAFYDALTGLPNRRLVTDRLAESIKQAQLSRQALAVLFVDLDRFQAVNETRGHEIGDDLLIQASRRIKACLNPTDTLGRYGVDVFAAIMGNVTDRAWVDRVAADVVAALAQPFIVGGQSLTLSASVGVAISPDDGTTCEGLLKRANQARNGAKASGGGRVAYFTAALQEAADMRQRLSTDLRQAIIEEQLSIHYQPIVDLRTGAIRKAEALLRWHHPSLGMVRPTTFIPIAESSGLIHALGEWVFREAAKQVKHWRNQHGTPLQVSVNRSPIQFAAASVPAPRPAIASASGGPLPVAPWPEQLEAMDLPADSVVLEITEGLLLDERPEVERELSTLRTAGIAISLDDFGTGYSSLSYLTRYAVDFIKIDRSFVSDLQPGTRNHVLCRTIIGLAHDLGIQVVAEGVETETELRVLMEAGCDYAQGYLLAKPMPAPDFESLLAKTSRGASPWSYWS